MHKVPVLALTLGALAIGAAPAVSTPITWVNGGSGSWTTVANWNPPQVPMVGDDATINNGGTANQTGLPINVTNLNIGVRTDSASFLPHGTGTVNVTNGNVLLFGGALSVGVTNTGILLGTQGSSTGSLTTIGGLTAAGNVTVGGDMSVGRFIFGPAGTATGNVDIRNGALASFGELVVGQTHGAGTGNGTLTVGNNIGAFNGFVIGSTRVGSSGDANGTASVLVNGVSGLGSYLAVGQTLMVSTGNATGSLTVNGDVSGMEIITIASGAGSGSTTGAVEIGAGIINVRAIAVGTSIGDPSIMSGTNKGELDILSGGILGSNALNSLFIVGSAQNGAVADGRATIVGDVTQFADVIIGNTGVLSGGNNVGVVDIAGILSGNETGDLTVGTTSGAGDSNGALSTDGQIVRFSDVKIGVVDAGASGNAMGKVDILSGGLSGDDTGDLNVGRTAGAGTGDGALSAAGDVSGFDVTRVGSVTGLDDGASIGDGIGLMTVGGSFTGVGAGSRIEVGRVFDATGSADGTLEVANGISNIEDVIVGEHSSFEAMPGSATGELRVLSGGITGVNAANSNFNVGRSRGIGPVMGTATVTGGISGFEIANIGVLGGSPLLVPVSVTGNVDILSGGLMGTGTNNGNLNVGVSNGPASAPGFGLAQGTLSVTGGVSQFASVNIGNVGTDVPASATGSLTLIDGDLMAASLRVGVSEGTGTATGTLNLKDNLAVVGDTMILGDGSTIQLDLGGTLRGIDFGAIDADMAVLDGALDLMFSFVPMPGVFDLIISGALDGIAGDFHTVNFFGLAPGTLATYGVVVDQGVEIWRLEIGQGDPIPDPPSQVSEPGTLVILAFGLMVSGIARRRRKV